MTIFHNNRCSKSRGALSILKEKGINPDVRYYLEEPPSTTELEGLLKKLKLKAVDLVRKNEPLYKENYKDKEYSEKEWLTILSENPKLIQRPIVINGDKAVIARPIERVEEIR